MECISNTVCTLRGRSIASRIITIEVGMLSRPPGREDLADVAGTLVRRASPWSS
ncbi:hypothetical protein HCU01_38170 [Halomonas cupida]|uniref:Uncharacterized protein n=1 Tax=Halomonas cupida TaxID=44933 RepID=A0ABQ0WMW3_9GAMM|nr:hypothetical protein HCU01_38170 [Halomonas cupida]